LLDNLQSFPYRPLGSHPPARGQRPAAVAVVLLPDASGQSCFLLTRRGALRRHAGQYALPGGRQDEGETAERAALRELREEVGLDLEPESVLGRLDDYSTRSGFCITPVVAWAPTAPDLVLDPAEVAEVYRVPLAELAHPDVPILTSIPESDRPVLSVPLMDTLVFSPTASILYQLIEVAYFGRPTRVAHFEQPVFAWR
jgi:8-oxo-dGTP pyrophosphatase MutT (NUDIX family)